MGKIRNTTRRWKRSELVKLGHLPARFTVRHPLVPQVKESMVYCVHCHTGAFAHDLKHPILSRYCRGLVITDNGFDKDWIKVINQVLDDREADVRIKDLDDDIWSKWIGPMIDEIEDGRWEELEK